MYLRIAYLADHPEHHENIIDWLQPFDGADYVSLKNSLDPLKKLYLPITLIALLDEEIVGLLSLTENSNKVLKVTNLYVTEEKRNNGFGTTLLNYAVEEALSLGYDRLFVNTCDGKFFIGHGWELEDTDLYWKDLNEVL